MTWVDLGRNWMVGGCATIKRNYWFMKSFNNTKCNFSSIM